MAGVVITGGASGIGRATADVLVGEGRSVAVWDLDPRVGEVGAALSGSSGGSAIGIRVDVTDAAAVAAAVERSAEALGGIDGLVHAAGAVSPDPVGALTDENWDLVVDVNLKAYAFLAQAVLPHLEVAAGEHEAGRSPHGPAVVGISSIEGLVGNAAIPAYCASKSGVLGVTRSLAHHLGPSGIRVNAVCPGFVETPMLQIALDVPGLRESLEAESPLGRLAQPVEVAHAVAFLLSARASFITGAHLAVDGGATAIL